MSNINILARKLQLKHKLLKSASINAEEMRNEIVSGIHTAILNATQQNMGIMKFPDMIKQDGVQISFDVRIDNRFGIVTMDVDRLTIQPIEKEAGLKAKYEPLLKQVKDYLSKYWELFPFVKGKEGIDYRGFVFTLKYS